MDQKLVDGIMAEFEKLSHNEQVDLFLEIRTRLLIDRDKRVTLHKENCEIAQSNLDTLVKGNQVIIDPNSQSIKAG